MRLSIYGKDWLIVDENNLEQLKQENKVHLIKLNFDEPTTSKVNRVLDKFNYTNRFFIEDNIKFYNNILKNNKKYYVENKPEQGLISFFKKNNKVLLNLNNLSNEEKIFVEENIEDILKNVEVLRMNRVDLKDLEENLKSWNGNVLIRE